mmetsp:Transcript_29890/g.22150  ORF Transcript_29890/g.22150 Transcript_29890/m.22150 type:complete len:102 (+) Transcript_29890:397-702(+)
MNPDFKETITRNNVREFLKELSTIAIELAKDYNSFVEKKDEELDKYIEELGQMREDAIETAVRPLQADVDRKMIGSVVFPDWTTTYGIRSVIHPTKAKTGL